LRLIDGYAHTEQYGHDTKALDPRGHDERAPRTVFIVGAAIVAETIRIRKLTSE
jgi:hypothetical protein